MPAMADPSSSNWIDISHAIYPRQTLDAFSLPQFSCAQLLAVSPKGPACRTKVGQLAADNPVDEMDDCNVNVLQYRSLIPHTHCTHTEVISHISRSRFQVGRSFYYDWTKHLDFAVSLPDFHEQPSCLSSSITPITLASSAVEEQLNAVLCDVEAVPLVDESMWRQEFLIDTYSKLLPFDLKDAQFYLEFGNFKGDLVVTLDAFLESLAQPRLQQQCSSISSIKALVFRVSNNPIYLESSKAGDEACQLNSCVSQVPQPFSYSNPAWPIPYLSPRLCYFISQLNGAEDISSLSAVTKVPLPSFITKLHIRHLLLDLPSIDRQSCNGNMLGHRLFFHDNHKFQALDDYVMESCFSDGVKGFTEAGPQLMEGFRNVCRQLHDHPYWFKRFLTELCYIPRPSHVSSMTGLYSLKMQACTIFKAADAIPCRPLIKPLAPQTQCSSIGE